MRYYLLFALVSLAGYSFVCLLASGAVALAWRPLRNPIDRLTAARRARWLLFLRLAPTAMAAAAAVTLGLAFVEYEPRETRESAGSILTILALGALALAALATSRAARLFASDSAVWRLMQHCRQWTSRDGAAAALLETAYPIAAVAGILQPRLMLSARVLEECTADEISAIVAHERAHVRRRDNLARAVISTLPDRWFAPRVNDALERAWTRAAEEAADREAAGDATAARAALAATLIRVAGMADAPPPSWMPQLAFYQGIDLEHRVRTLLAEPRHDASSILALEAATIAIATLALAGAVAASSNVHRLIEWSVALLP